MKHFKKSIFLIPVVVVFFSMITGCVTESDQSGEDLNSSTAIEEAMDKVEGYLVEKKKLIAKSGDHDVAGILYQPVGLEGKLPIVIISHGFSGFYSAYEYLNNMLASAGIPCFAFDYYGGSKNSMSGGNMMEMNVFTEKDDLNAVIEMLIAEPTVDENSIYIMGHSQGGFVASLSAFEKPDKIAGMLLFAPALMIPDVAHQMADSIENLRKIDFETKYAGMLSSQYFEVVWDYDIYAHMEEYTGDVHIMHGDLDTDVPMAYSERAVETFPNAHLTVLTGETHIPSPGGYGLIVDALMEMIGN